MKIDAPRMNAPALALVEDAEPGDALDPAGTDGLRIAEAVFDAVTRHDATYRETELVRATVTGSHFTNCRFIDVRFEGLDAPDLIAARSTWRDTEILGSRLGTAGLYDATVSSLRLERCKIGFLGLQGAEVHDLLVESCTVDELDLTEAKLTRVAFRDTTIGELRLAHSQLSHVDLRGARLGAVSPTLGLRGAVVTVEQLLDLAPVLAHEAGIVVE